MPYLPSSRPTGRAPKSLVIGAATLAGSYAFTALHARRAERQHPPIRRFVEVDGVRLHFVEQGRGTPIVLLHGEGSLLQDFTLSILPPLAERYWVIAFDRPGYGYSARPQDRSWTARQQALIIKAALRKLGADKPVIVGHSWGALCALACAVACPEDLRAAVLIAGFFYPEPRAGALLMSSVSQPVIGSLLSHTVAAPAILASVPVRTRALFWPSEIPDNYLQFPFSLLARPRQIEAYGEDNGLLLLSAAELAPHYGKVSAPLAIIAGEGDRVLSWRKHSLRLHQEAPCSTLLLGSRGGHMPHHIDQDLVIGAIECASGTHRGSESASSAFEYGASEAARGSPAESWR